jgi:ABC-type taurine transport system ATPase subunit
MIPMTDNLSIPIQITFAQLLDAVDQLSKSEQHQLLLHVLRRHEEDNLIVTHFASEQVLAKDWNNSIENEVWRDL